jgi:hypothetical protein
MRASIVPTWNSFACAQKQSDSLPAENYTMCPPTLSSGTHVTVQQLMQWATDKVVVIATVVDTIVVGRAIEELYNISATNTVIIRLALEDYRALTIALFPRWESFYFGVSLTSPDEVAMLLALKPQWLNRIAFVYLKYYDTGAPYTPTQLSQIRAAGIRIMAKPMNVGSPWSTPNDHQVLFDAGVNVVLTTSLPVALIARNATNQARGLVV